MTGAVRPLVATSSSLGLLAVALVGLATAAPPRLAAAAPTESLQNPLTYDFMCEGCHTFANNPMAMDLPPHAPGAYAGTMMANAARDPVFWAGVALASEDHPDETVDCVRCHSPRAFLEGRGDAIAVSDLIPPDFDSVSCEVCHRAVDDGETPAGNARFVLDDVLVDGEPPRRGPWAYEDPNGPDPPPHPTIQDLEFLPSSRLCGTCHDVTTGRERVDDQGQGMGVAFNEQRTYSEWLGSALAVPGDDFRSCQDCHMSLVEVPAAGCLEYEGLGVSQPGARRHLMFGANIQGLRVIADNSPGADQDAIEAALPWMQDFLASAATLEAGFPASVDASAGFAVDGVRVTNETGHKLPSGYSEGRVMWLELRASYAGEVVWSSGLWDGGAIERDPQLRSYEGVAERWADGTRNHLLLNDHWALDTRIPPLGLGPNLETDPVGDRYTLLPDNTWPNYDEHAYAFAAADIVDQTPEDPSDDELELELRLLYLINSQPYLDQLRDDNVVNDAGQAAWDMYLDDGGPQPVVLASQVASVPLTGLVEPEPGDGDGDSGDGDSGDGDGETATTGDASETGPGTETSETGGPAAETGDGGCGCGVADPSPERGRGFGLVWLLGVSALARRRTRRSR